MKRGDRCTGIAVSAQGLTVRLVNRGDIFVEREVERKSKREKARDRSRIWGGGGREIIRENVSVREEIDW